jgi:predicted ATPase
MSLTPERWKEIEDLYHASLEQAPEAREKLLASAPADVREMVERLLMTKPPDILDHRAWELETAGDASTALSPGSNLGPYLIESKVGAGGMGEVFRASDTRLARKVAIKAIRTGRSNGLSETRLLEEARAASALNHPNIITVYDVGSVDGRPYIVMEWIDGQTLRERLKQGFLPIPEVIDIGREILEALAAAHEGGILHRDLKPENIMLTGRGRVKVLDFGIAKRLESDLTTAGLAVGTPAYMSPEQMRGEKLDFRSDHFSFGALLYELAAGRKAFRGESVGEIQNAVLFGQPEPLTRLNSQAPAPLQWLVNRCLAKSARDRFSSTEALRNELAAIAAGSGQRAAEQLSSDSIPAAKTVVIGREAEITQLWALLADADVRMITLTGPGGMGKTRLAMEIARQAAGQFAGGVGFVQLDKVQDASFVASEITRALGVPDCPANALEQAVANRLRQLAGPALLVLDNFEHVLEAAVFVARIVSDRLKVVVTSRSPLRVYGEYEFAVPPLDSGRAGHGRTALSPAVRLFLDRAPGLRGRANDPESLRVISQICDRLDGLPLAIELAAARTRLFPLKTLEAKLADPLAVLVGGSRDLPERQHTLRATLDWSYNLLDAKHQMLFRRMAVFVGGATIEAIEAVCDTRQDLGLNLWDAIELLVDNSLFRRVESESAEPRFALLETMREYGLERLAAADEDAYTRRAHAAYCLVLAEESPVIRREHMGRHLFDSEMGNFRAALDWLIAAGQAEWGLRLHLALGQYFFSRRLIKEGLDRITRLLELPEADRFARLRAIGLFTQAELGYETGGRERTDAYLAVWKIFEEAGDRAGMFQCATRLAVNLRFDGKPGARYWAEQSIEMAKESRNKGLLAGALTNLASIEEDSDIVSARGLYVEAMQLFESAGDEENAVWSLSHQADLYRAEGNVPHARYLYNEALERFRRLNFSLGIASCLHDLAWLEKEEGNLGEAETLYREALGVYGPNNPTELPRGFECLAEVAILRGQPERAMILCGAAGAIRERLEVRTRNPARRAAVENRIEAARRDAGPKATEFWMKGWNMSVEEALEWVAKQ